MAQHIAQIGQNSSVIRLQYQSTSITGDGSGQLALGAQADAHFTVYFCIARVQAQGPTIGHDSLLMVTLAVKVRGVGKDLGSLTVAF
jgi:hypothetical protein